MYKQASHNQQVHSKREVRANAHGIDPTVFHSAEHQQLVRQKRILEAQLSALSERIKTASRIARATGKYVDVTTFNNWSSQKSQLIQDIHTIEDQLMAFKRPVPQSVDALNKAFIDMAKELLADPVFNRIITAAIHRLGEQQE